MVLVKQEYIFTGNWQLPPIAIILAIKPIYRDIPNPELFEKCFIFTQNVNEVFECDDLGAMPVTHFASRSIVETSVKVVKACLIVGNFVRSKVLSNKIKVLEFGV